MMNKSSLTSQHVVRLEVSNIVKYLSTQALDILKEELHSDDLNDIEVTQSMSSIIFVKNLEY